MAELATEFAKSKSSLVVAPAGCGKTQLIAESVKMSSGRQLVLTHTHAGVKALKDRLVELEVPPQLYHVTTLDSFCNRFAGAYPSVSGWNVREPERDQWAKLRPGTLKVLNMDSMANVLAATYGGVFVDEYQDCGSAQHAVISRIADILPCRVVGDPLQAVFRSISDRQNDSLPWSEVKERFALFAELSEPHRWAKKNEDLGRWLLDIRGALLENQTFTVGKVPGLRFKAITRATAVREQCVSCFEWGKVTGETVIGVHQSRRHCHQTCGYLGNLFSVFEDAECTDLLGTARAIESATGSARVAVLIREAARWLTLSHHNLKSIVRTVTSRKPAAVKDTALVALHGHLELVRDDPSFEPVLAALRALSELDGAKYRSREIWLGLIDGVQSVMQTPGLSLRDAIWRKRDLLRRVGRHPPPRCLSTPLLVKGLQCDHGLVMNTSDLPEAEWLYVALTRASRTLTILGPSPDLRAKVCADVS